MVTQYQSKQGDLSSKLLIVCEFLCAQFVPKFTEYLDYFFRIFFLEKFTEYLFGYKIRNSRKKAI